MKTGLKILSVAAVLLLTVTALSGCDTIVNRIAINITKGNGELTTLVREIEALGGIINKTSFHVVIDPTMEENTAVIEAESNLIDFIMLSQDSDGVVTVDAKPNSGIETTKQATVTLPAIHGGTIIADARGDITAIGDPLQGDAFHVMANGSGNIDVALSASSLRVSINGSGSITADLTADTLTADLNGSGSFNAKGSAGTLTLTLDASGDYNGFDCATDDAHVNVHGSGSANVNPAGSLTGSINASGSIVYAGSPASVDISDSGSGSVHPR